MVSMKCEGGCIIFVITVKTSLTENVYTMILPHNTHLPHSPVFRTTLLVGHGSKRKQSSAQEPHCKASLIKPQEILLVGAFYYKLINKEQEWAELIHIVHVLMY